MKEHYWAARSTDSFVTYMRREEKQCEHLCLCFSAPDFPSLILCVRARFQSIAPNPLGGSVKLKILYVSLMVVFFLLLVSALKKLSHLISQLCGGLQTFKNSCFRVFFVAFLLLASGRHHANKEPVDDTYFGVFSSLASSSRNVTHSPFITRN